MFLSLNIQKALTYHDRRLSAKREEFRKRQQKLFQDEFKSFYDKVEQFAWESGKESKYGPDWYNKVMGIEASEK